MRSASDCAARNSQLTWPALAGPEAVPVDGTTGGRGAICCWPCPEPPCPRPTGTAGGDARLVSLPAGKAVAGSPS